MKNRCDWCKGSKIYEDYHDNEWGIPVYDDQRLFENLTLESFQSGLNWLTILKKRAEFRRVFANFDPLIVANFSNEVVEELMLNQGIVRHRAKIHAAINNAKCFLKIQKKYGSFSKFIWAYKELENVDKITLSEVIFKDLKALGFKFLGKTTIYAFLEASGIINNHQEACYLFQKSKVDG